MDDGGTTRGGRLPPALEDAQVLLARDRSGRPAGIPADLLGDREFSDAGAADHLGRAHPEDRATIARAWAAAREQPGEATVVEARATVDGTWQRVRICYVDLTEDPAIGLVLIGVTTLGAAAIGATELPATPSDAAWGLLHIGPVGDILSAEGAVEALYGAPAHQLVGRNGLDLIHPDDHAALLDAWVRVLERRDRGRAVRQRVVRADGTVRWVLTSITRPDPLGPVIVHDLDLSQQLAAESALEASDARFRLLADEVPAAVFVGDADGRIRFANRRLVALVGDGRPMATVGRLLHADDAARWAALVAEAERTGGVEFESVSPAGPVLRVRCQAPQPDGTVVAVVDDITSTTRLRDQARVDALTGLLNRSATVSEIEQAVGEVPPDTVVAFIDLDGFKAVNDRFGHAVGDRVLVAAAAALRGAVRPDDRVGRWGGDEFVVVASHVPPGAEDDFRERVQRALARDEGDGRGVRRASIGLTRIRPGDTVDAVVNRADAAMYVHKRAQSTPEAD